MECPHSEPDETPPPEQSLVVSPKYKTRPAILRPSPRTKPQSLAPLRSSSPNSSPAHLLLHLANSAIDLSETTDKLKQVPARVADPLTRRVQLAPPPSFKSTTIRPSPVTKSEPARWTNPPPARDRRSVRAPDAPLQADTPARVALKMGIEHVARYVAEKKDVETVDESIGKIDEQRTRYAPTYDDQPTVTRNPRTVMKKEPSSSPANRQNSPKRPPVQAARRPPGEKPVVVTATRSPSSAAAAATRSGHPHDTSPLLLPVKLIPCHYPTPKPDTVCSEASNHNTAVNKLVKGLVRASDSPEKISPSGAKSCRFPVKTFRVDHVYSSPLGRTVMAKKWRAAHRPITVSPKVYHLIESDVSVPLPAQLELEEPERADGKPPLYVVVPNSSRNNSIDIAAEQEPIKNVINTPASTITPAETPSTKTPAKIAPPTPTIESESEKKREHVPDSWKPAWIRQDNQIVYEAILKALRQIELDKLQKRIDAAKKTLAVAKAAGEEPPLAEAEPEPSGPQEPEPAIEPRLTTVSIIRTPIPVPDMHNYIRAHVSARVKPPGEPVEKGEEVVNLEDTTDTKHILARTRISRDRRQRALRELSTLSTKERKAQAKRRNRIARQSLAERLGPEKYVQYRLMKIQQIRERRHALRAANPQEQAELDRRAKERKEALQRRRTEQLEKDLAALAAGIEDITERRRVQRRIARAQWSDERRLAYVRRDAENTRKRKSKLSPEERREHELALKKRREELAHLSAEERAEIMNRERIERVRATRRAEKAAAAENASMDQDLGSGPSASSDGRGKRARRRSPDGQKRKRGRPRKDADEVDERAEMEAAVQAITSPVRPRRRIVAPKRYPPAYYDQNDSDDNEIDDGGDGYFGAAESSVARELEIEDEAFMLNSEADSADNIILSSKARLQQLKEEAAALEARIAAEEAVQEERRRRAAALSSKQ